MWTPPRPRDDFADSGAVPDDIDLSDSSDTSSDDNFQTDVPLIEDTNENAGKYHSSGSSDDDSGDEAETTGNAPDPSAFKSNYEIDPKDIILGPVIGAGAYGKVYNGTLYGKSVAVKKLTTKFMDEKALAAFGLEVDIMCSLRHPNVLLFMGACTSPGNLTIITELMPKGSVADLLKDKKNKPSFKQCMRYAKDAALGMNWLHNSTPPILHLDLKTANLLVDENDNVKVGDFGLSKINRTGTNRGLLGSPVYMSPEMLLNIEYDEKTDIYSFGVVLAEMVSGEEPFAGEFSDMKQLIEAIVKNNRRPKMPPCPMRLSNLIKDCWNTVPSKRPSFDDMLSNNVFEVSIVEGIIKDRAGASIWMSKFLGKDSAHWDDFLKAFCEYHKVTAKKLEADGKLAMLKALIADNEKEKVTIEEWAKILECFGPMDGLNIFDNMAALLSKEWFFGNLNEKEADILLTAKKRGTFIVRFSSDPGSFTITTKSKEGLSHYRIRHKAGQPYVLGTSEFDSLDAVIKQHKKKLGLKTPCKGSKFQALVSKKAGIQTSSEKVDY